MILARDQIAQGSLGLVDPHAGAVALQHVLPEVRLVLRSCRSSLMGLRRDPRDGQLVLRVDPDLLTDPDYPVSVANWVRRRGRGGTGPELQRCLQAATHRRNQRQVERASEALAGTPTIGEGASLANLASQVHATWFADLPMAQVSWGRRPPGRRLRHIRFGCYRRASHAIEITPRLDRPWIAISFLTHVLHHEYCHHRQAMTPLVRREGAHSPRFRAWERAFPDYQLAIRWERLALPWLLDDARPPWYRP